MFRTAAILLAASALATTACATKRYGRLAPLSSAETNAYDCKDIALELAKIQAFEDQIADEAGVDGRSALGFLGDFGIGNKMERDDAEKSARERRQQLEALQASQRCSTAG